MMIDTDRLRVNESSLTEVLSVVRKYHGEERSSKPTGACQPSDCLAEIDLPPDLYSRHPWMIPLVKRIGVHVFDFSVTFWVEGGKLTAVEEVFFVPRRVGADVYVTTIRSNPTARNCRSASYQLHPGFMTNYRERYGAPEFTYWINAGKPQAPPLPHMGLRCVTTLAGCNSIAQILPTQWDQHQLDQPNLRTLKAGTGLVNSTCR